MIRVCALLFLLVAFTMPVKADPLDDYVWKNRVLLIFNDGPSGEQSEIVAQAQNGFEERDFVIIHARSGDDFNGRFDISEGYFSVILIGKDGGEKAQWDAPVQATEIFMRVDAMPMRQREMLE